MTIHSGPADKLRISSGPNAKLRDKSYTNATQLHKYISLSSCAADREEEEEEEAGKRLPLGPISPSRILCAALSLSPSLLFSLLFPLSLSFSLSLSLSPFLSLSLSLYFSLARSAGGVSEYLSTRICGCDCGEAAATLLAQSAAHSVGLKTETAPKATNKVGADGRRGRRKGGKACFKAAAFSAKVEHGTEHQRGKVQKSQDIKSRGNTAEWPTVGALKLLSGIQCNLQSMINW